MNHEPLDLAGHPVVVNLLQRLSAIESQLESQKTRLEQLEAEHQKDHCTIEKLEKKPEFALPKPSRIAVGL